MKNLYFFRCSFLVLVLLLIGNNTFASPIIGADSIGLFTSTLPKIKSTRIFPEIPYKSPEGDVYKKNSETEKFEIINTTKLNDKTNQIISFDPVRFSITANADSIAIGKEIELVIKADFLDVHPQLMFTFEGSNEYTLKMLIPKDFIVTGGTYYDYIRGKVSRENPIQFYTIKGYFEGIAPNSEFKLLRSHKDATSNDFFVVKASISFRQVQNMEVYVLDKNGAKTRVANVQNTQECFSDFRFAVSTSASGGCSIRKGEVLNFVAVACPAPAVVNWYKKSNGELGSLITSTIGNTLKDTYDSTKKIYYATCTLGSCIKTTPEVNFGFGGYISPSGLGTLVTEQRYFCPTAATPQVLTASCVPGQPRWNNDINNTANTITITSASPSIYSYECVQNGCSSTPYNTTYQYSIIENCSGGNGCSSFPITVSNNSPNQELTPPSTLNLTATKPDAQSTFYWTGPANFYSSSQNPNLINTIAAMSGVYTVTVRNAAGCISTASTTVNLQVVPCITPPKPVIYARTTSSSNCSTLQAGDNIELTTTGCPYTVIWDDGFTGNIRSVVFGNTATTYTARCVDRTCQSLLASVTYSPNNAYISSTAQTIPCNGNGLIIAANCLPGVAVWSDGTQSTTFLAKQAGRYNYQCKNNTCPGGGLSFVDVTVSNPPPVINANKTVICGTIPVILTATVCAGTVKWAGPGISTLVTGATYQTLLAGSYTAICTTNCGDSSPSNQITLTAAPALVFTISNNSPTGQVTVGGTVTFSVTTAATNLTYNWTGPNNFIATSPSPSITNVTAVTSGKYFLTAISSAGCIVTDSTTVSISTCAGINLVANNNSKNGEIAAGGTVNLSATSTATGLTYAWAGPNNFSSTLANPIISSATVAINGTYTVTATNTAGCVGTATTKVLLQDVSAACEGFKIKAINPANSTETSNLTRNPTNTSEFLPLTLSIEPTSGGNTTGFTYSWTGPEGFTFTTPTAATPSINKPGEYKVVITKTVGTPCSLTIKIGSGPCVIKPVNYTTCKPVTIVNPNATNLAQALTAGSKFYAADYLVDVYEALGTPQGWTGKGKIEVVLIGGIKANVGVEFNNIQINDCYELVNGTIKTAYDPTWGNIVDVDGVIDDLKSLYDRILSSFQKTKDDLQLLSEPELTTTLIKFLEEIDVIENSIQLNKNLSEEERTVLLQKLNVAKGKISQYTSCSINPNNLNTESKARLNGNSNILDCGTAKLDAINEIDKILNGVKNDVSRDVILFTPNWQPFSIKALGKTFLDNTQSPAQGTVYGFKINNIDYKFKDGRFLDSENKDINTKLDINYSVQVALNDTVYIYETINCPLPSKLYKIKFSNLTSFRQNLIFAVPSTIKFHSNVRCIGTRFLSDESFIFEGDLRNSPIARKVDSLQNILMNNAEYDKYLKNVIILNGGQLTDAKLQSIYTSLLELQKLVEAAYDKVEPGLLDKLINFIKQCQNPTEINQGCSNEGGIVPRCIWDNNNVPQPIAYQIALMSGFVDGAASTIGGLFSLAKFVGKYANYFSCWTVPIRLVIDPTCSANRTDAINQIKKFKEFLKEPDPIKAMETSLTQMGSTFMNVLGALNNEFWTWGKQVTCYEAIFNGNTNLNCCAYKQGRLVFDVLSLLVGVEELKLIADGAKWATVFGSMATKGATLLKGIKALGVSTLKMTRNVAETSYIIFQLSAAPAFNALERPIAGIAIELTVDVAKAPVSTLKIGNVTNTAITSAERTLIQDAAKVPATHSIESAKIVTASGVEIQVAANAEIHHLAVQQVANVVQDVVVISTQKANGVYVPVLVVINGVGKVVPEEDPTPQNCSVCGNKQISKRLCDKLTALAAKGSNTTAVTKLCTSIVDNIVLEKIADKLNNSFNPDETIQFLNDITPNNQTSAFISSRVSSLNEGLIDSWKTMTLAANIGTSFARDFVLLQKINEINNDNTKILAFNNNILNFLTSYSDTDCNTCPNPGVGSHPYNLPKLHIILENTVKAFQTHNGKPGFNVLYNREILANGNDMAARSKRDGGQHMLKYLADNPFTNNAIAFDQNFSSGQPTDSYQSDIFMGSSAPIRYIECKSYAIQSNLNADTLSQFIGYIIQPDLFNLSQLKYVFNAKKLSKYQAKEKIHKYFRNQDVATLVFNKKQSLFILIEISPNNFIDTPAKLFAFATDPALDADFKSKVLSFVDTN